MYILTKFCCNRSLAVRSQLVVDPCCKGLILFIDLFLRRSGRDYWIRSREIWFTENFLSYYDLSGFFLMYAVSGFGEGLCNVVHLCKINIWCDAYGSIIVYCYRSVVMLQLCFVKMTCYKCGSVYFCYINAICGF